MKRVGLFLLTNLAVLAVLAVTSRLLGVDRFLTQNGLDLPALFGFAAVFGMGGALISLALSRWMAVRSTGARVIGQPADATERWLLDTVARQAQMAGLPMPQVAIFDSPQPNAFATGPSRARSLVAVSSGLLEQMDRRQVEAVLAHEISHIANGDMVTLTLIQGVVNTFVIALARIVGYAVDRALAGGQEREAPGPGFWITSLVCELLLGILATMVVMAFSRRREFRADAGGARLAGRGAMIAALERLRAVHEPQALPASLNAFGILGGKALARLFMSHPPLEERIAALRAAL
ncbi:MAG: protease HtpX [Immundisolibacter sp.]|uniref:protease HtpX n=1 Tax=Immundisolibacter sp. TaxID=1934948 RepID=UPI00198CEF70|nr:protease HtpX [Immundisolibacter sp.]MBC7160545.1 protease HtpX [Immundisolibacter sp.]